MADVTFTLGADARDFQATLAAIDKQIEAMARRHGAFNLKGFELSPAPGIPEQAWRKVNPLEGIQPMAGQTWRDSLNVPQSISRKSEDFSAVNRRLLMPMLGLLFAGMALQRAMTGLIQQSATLAGIFDVINTMLGLFFLPIMLWLLDPLFILFDLFVSMDEQTQMIVGAFVILAIIAGMLLTAFAQIVIALGAAKGAIDLFAGALAGIFGGGGTAAAGGGGAGAGLAGLLGPLLIIAAIIIIIILAFERFWKLIVDVAVLLWAFIAGTFDAIINVIIGAIRIIGGALWAVAGVVILVLGIIWGLLTGHWEMAQDGWRMFVDGVGSIVKGLIQILGAVLGWIFLAFFVTFALIGVIIGGVVETISIALSKIITWLVETFMPDMKQPWSDFASWLGGLWDGLKTTIMGYLQPILDAIDAIKEGTKGMTENAGNTEGRWLPWFAEGGPVPSTGLAMLHAGEYVVPRGGMLVAEGGGGGNLTVNVYANVANDVDITTLANEIARIWHIDKRGI